MKAAVFHGPNQPLLIENVEIDEPLEREVIVKVMASGVCHSDLHFVDGLYPMAAPAILGHEVAGIVEKVGSQVVQFQVGDQVIGCLSLFCGSCKYCLQGRPNLCQNPEVRRRTVNRPKYTLNGSPVGQMANLGSYAEKMLVHENTLVKMGNGIGFEQAALIGCGVTTGVGAVLNTARIPAGATVAVWGAGGVGLAAIQGAKIAGAGMIIAVDMIESKLKTARDLGATHVVDASSHDPVQAVKDLTGGGVEYSFEAIGNKRAAEQCYEALERGGTATIIGMIPVGQKVEIDGPSLLGEKQLQGSSMGSTRYRSDMPKYIDFYKRGLLNLDDMITRTGTLEDVNEAFRAMKAGEVARTVLKFY